jgi:hypothetical protein
MAGGCLFVRMEGLEPPHLAASDPKSDVSTNFTTSGLAFLLKGCKCRAFTQITERIKSLFWAGLW